jgi:1-acyl-sn-glycerol-3-phosphate acyltransferase
MSVAGMDRGYALVRGFARFWLWFFFRRARVRHPERVPRTGPVLLCINHPNNLIDSLVVGAAVPRKVNYLATATLFRNPLLGGFLRSMGVIPVYRRQDDPAKMDKNVQTFAAVSDALAAGQLVAIYPEGTTHAEARVQRIKTGAARIALEFEDKHPGRLTMVPVGLTFEARHAFRGHVLASFGPAVPVSPYLEAYRREPTKAVDALTDALQWAMEAEVVNVERVDDARLVSAVEALYRDDLAREVRESRGIAPHEVDLVRLSRGIVDAVDWFKTHDPACRVPVAADPVLPRAPRRVPRARRCRPRLAHAPPAARASDPRVGSNRRLADLRLRRRRQRAAVLLPPLAGAPLRASRDRLHDDSPALGHRRLPALLGARDVGGVGLGEPAGDGGVRGFAADFGPDRVPLSGWG